MEESRLDKMEDMLATLITMAGNMNSRLENSIAEQSKMSERLDCMEESFNARFEKIDERMDKLQEDQRSMRREIMEKLIVIQADRRLTGSKTPTSSLRENQRNLNGGSTARKGPIGSTNHQWGMKEPSH
ncbi:hypothetical protein KHA94_17205 [Bacillus sp. FJAT-49705]|uniref:Uncharacterized protein n=1 Tax=Cytobacillus citreus TaxID=2833586 RepID=A0ABS5NVR2_9BACI|nr:hypothetical protein [Cytobacillus citreus]MBS4191908.1 hypothetical protein [Cytobacillus citreus]